MESSVYKNVISTPLRCLIAGRRPGAQLAVNRDRRSRPPAAGSGAERHANRAASTPSRGRRCKASRLDRQNCSVKQSQTARLSPHTAVSKRPGGRRHPRRKTGAARHAKTGFLSELLSQAPATKTTLRMPIIIQPSRRDGRPTPPPAASRNVRSAHLRSRWRRPKNCNSKATAPERSASRRHPTRREVPLGTRRLGFARQRSLVVLSIFLCEPAPAERATSSAK